jgi:AraC-like DNA-binding protein
MEVFFFIGIVISFLLALLVLTKKRKHTSDIVFGVWQLFFLLHFTILYIRYSELSKEMPYLQGMDAPFVLIHIPLIYYYTLSILGDRLSLIKKVLHFLPFGVLLLLALLSFVFYPQEDRLMLYDQQLAKQYSIIDLFFVLQILFYFPRLFKKLQQFSKRIKNEYSNIDTIHLKWLKRIIVGTVSAFLLNTVLILIYYSYGVLSVEFIGKTTVLIVCVLQIYLGYYGLKYTPVFLDIPLPKKEEPAKYDKTGIDYETTKQKFKALLVYMEKEKPYLNTDLTLRELAKGFGVNDHHLSQMINEQANKNFYLFVNLYRLEEFIVLLKNKDYDRYTILAIAYEAGFKSKSVFNTLFKKEKGMTPSEFRKTL